MCGKKHSEETKQKMSDSRSNEKHPMYGKHHSADLKQKMSTAKINNLPKQCGSGELNPMHNRVWYTNGINSKPIKQDEIEYYESIGYHKGRASKV